MITETDISWIVENWDKISKEFKTSISQDKSNYYGKQQKPKGLDDDENEAIFLLSRQKPSIEQDYSFDEERIGITNKGKIIWGFDSGCSCPTPWEDNYPNCYNIEKTWKEFIVKDLKDFDGGYMEEMEKRLIEIKFKINLEA
ncbi:MAG TPA: hypothetical protein VJ438_05975 [Candidatus Nanoarchaeia archaeon]|nr:hypothetical protein [Candidatus Nanoarchaeia archaeon]